MNEYFMEYTLELQKADHVFESAFDVLAINTLDILQAKVLGVMTEGTDEMLIEESGKFMTAVKEFFKKIVDAAKELVQKVTDKIQANIQAHEVNKKLKQLKKQLAVNRSIADGKTIKTLDTKKYMKAYTEYVTVVVKAHKALYSKEYASVDEYNEALAKIDEMLDKKFNDLKLNDPEGYIIEMSVFNSIEYTERELASIISVNKAFEAQWIHAMEELEAMAQAEDDSSKISDIKSAANSLNTKSASIFNKITSVPGKLVNSIAKFFKKSDDSSNN